MGYLLFAVAAAYKLLRAPLPLRLPRVAHDDVLQRCDEGDLPEVASEYLRQQAEQLGREGLALGMFYRAPRTDADYGYGAAFLDRDGALVAMIRWSQHPQRLSAGEISIATRTCDGKLLVTTSQPPFLDPPPEVSWVTTPPGSSIEAVVHHHRQRLTALPADTAVDEIDQADLEAFMDVVSRRAHEYQVSRGVYVEVPNESSAGEAPGR